MRRALSLWLSAVAVPLLGAAACGGELFDAPGPVGGSGQGGTNPGGGAPGGGGSGGGGGDTFGCDPISPSFCGYPFPSNVYTVADDSTPTGLRVSFPAEVMPAGKSGHVQDPTPWSSADGFSASSAMLAHFPGAVGDGLPGVRDLAASLDDASPTVLLDVETGERLAHWSEIDLSALAVPGQPLAAPPPEQRSLLIHPAAPLRDGARYVVAIRGLVDEAGDPIEPSPAFAALRDDSASDEPSVEARRELYADIFGALDDAGVPRDDLQLAWDFTTASRANVTGWLEHIRDEAFDIVGDDGPAYTITNVDPDFDPATIAFKIEGTMTVPLYLSTPEGGEPGEPGAALIFGDDGMPDPNPDTPTIEVEWELLIPNRALTEPVALLQYGHGLLGGATQIESGHFRTFMETFGYAVFSTKMDRDVRGRRGLHQANMRNTGAMHDEARAMIDRLHQGLLNNLMVMRLMSTGLDTDPTYGQYLDGSRRFYWGISQGGIMGGVLMALSTDVTRSCLEVMGQPYNTLLNRSVDFDPFFLLVNTQWEDAREKQFFLGLHQMGWDRVEPAGYTKYMFDQPFSGSPADRRVLMRTARGDHQVTTFGGHVMARAMGAKHLDSGYDEIFDLENVTSQSIDENGAVYIEYDFGLPLEPSCNVPLSVCEDPHGKLRSQDVAREQLHIFFATGVFENRCPGQTCDFSALSGCVGGEDPDPCDDL